MDSEDHNRIKQRISLLNNSHPTLALIKKNKEKGITRPVCLRFEDISTVFMT